MSSGCYFPKAVKLVKTPKSNGGTRPLGIPTIGDKIIQMTGVLVITPRIVPFFHNQYLRPIYFFLAITTSVSG